MHTHTYVCIYMHIHVYIHIHILTWAGYIYMHIHAYTCIYIHIHEYTCIYIHIQTSANRCQEVFFRGGSRRPGASGWTPTYQTCCDRQWDGIFVCVLCMEDLHEEREGPSKGPGRVQHGRVRQIESAQTEPRAKKSECSDAQGCPECGPQTATPRDCV